MDKERFKSEIMAIVKARTPDQTGRLLLLLDILADVEEARLMAELPAARKELPTIPDDLRPEVLMFARLMERKLRRDDEKKGPGGWKASKARALFDRMLVEVVELDNTIRCNSGPEDVALEAADVANLAMMVADVAGGLK